MTPKHTGPAGLTKPRRAVAAGPTKSRRPLNPGHTKARQAMRADKCVFWAVILGSLTVALFGA